MNTSRRFATLALTLLTALAFATPGLRAATVVSNLGVPDPNNDTLDTAGMASAHAFTTGSAAQPLESISVRMSANTSPGSVRVKLWSGSGSVPATLVEDLGEMGVGVSPFTYTRLSTNKPVLAASTRYWVAVHRVSGSVNWHVATNLTTTGPGSMLDNQADSTTDGAAWSGYTQADRHVFAVNTSFLVTTTNDSGAGSLRQALADAAAAPGPDTITFATNLSGLTLQLTNSFSTSGTYTNDRSSLRIANDTGGVTVDATALPGGFTISDNGNSTYRLLHITNSTVTLRGLTFKDGGIATFGSSSGGAIFSVNSTVTLERCTFTGNIGDGGGAIFNADGPMTLRHCTLTGNTTTSAGPNTGDGGAIFNLTGPMSLTHCTVVSNTAPTGSSGAGGIMGYLGTVSLTNCIVAGNTINSNTTPADVRYHSSTLVSGGTNIVPASVNFGGAFSGTTLLTNAPLLAPLGNYGGPTPTMALLPGSPAINAAAVLTPAITNDQRGFPIVATPDIGAYEASLAVTLTVATTNDSGTGSLRWALANAAAAPGPDTITFATNLNGATIALATFTSPSGQNTAFDVTDTGGVTLDATALSAGVKLDGGSQNFRLFRVGSGASLTLHGLTLTRGGGASYIGAGGAIRNDGTLTLTRCTLSGHQGVGPSAAGGAIYNGGTATLTHCTLSGNSTDVDGYGGAIANDGTLALTHCTVSGNSAGNSGGGGGGVYVGVGSTLTLTNTLIAGNSAPNSPATADINNVGTVTRAGANLVQFLANFGTLNGPAHLTNAPLLAPLGNYGGPTPTMPPLFGSPAIDAAAVLSPAITNDQRGFSLKDGDGNGSTLPDIGAAEANAPLVVLNNADVGAGSLRQMLTNAAAAPGPDTITFAPALNGATITPTNVTNPNFLGNTAFDVTDTGGVTLDATALSAGVKLDGGLQNFRLFYVNAGASLTLHGLTLTRGGGPSYGGPSYDGGGAIYNAGTLTLTRCTLSGHQVVDSGDGRFGGAIYNGSTATLTHCTLSGNSAGGGGSGGAIHNDGTLALTHCTVSGNSASYQGGGVSVLDGTTLTLTNTLIAGNSAPDDPATADIYNLGTVTRAGANLVQFLDNTFGTVYGPAHLTNAPLLAPLGNYGGPTPTMALLPGSPARNAAGVLVPAITSDQRGFPIVGVPDIGAYEAGTLNSNYFAYIWETLPTAGDGTTNDPLHAATFDYDGDGQSNTNEWRALTDAADPASALRILAVARQGSGQYLVTFQSVPGLAYRLEYSTNLAAWPTATNNHPATGTNTVWLDDGTQTGGLNPTNRYYRVRVP